MVDNSVQQAPTPKPKTAVVVTAVLASAVIFSGLGYYIGTLYQGDTKEGSPLVTKIGGAHVALPSPTIYRSTYSNAANKVSITLPDGWTAVDPDAPAGLSSLTVYISDGSSTADTDRPSAATVKVYDSIKKLDGTNLGASSLKDYLDKSSALSEPTYQNVDQVKADGVSGYKAVSGPNQFGGGTHFFFARTDGSIVDLWLFDAADTDSLSILSSLKLN